MRHVFHQASRFCSIKADMISSKLHSPFFNHSHLSYKWSYKRMYALSKTSLTLAANPIYFNRDCLYFKLTTARCEVC